VPRTTTPPPPRTRAFADCVVAALEAEAGQDKREIDFEPFDKLLIDPGIARRLIEKTRGLITDPVPL
jgi:hypothetical protein